MRVFLCRVLDDFEKNTENKMKIEKNIFLGNQKRRTHHRYAFSPRGFERKQLIRILCEHKCALIFTLVADDLTNRCWVLTKTRLRSQKSVHVVHFKNSNAI